MFASFDSTLYPPTVNDIRSYPPWIPPPNDNCDKCGDLKQFHSINGCIFYKEIQKGIFSRVLQKVKNGVKNITSTVLNTCKSTLNIGCTHFVELSCAILPPIVYYNYKDNQIQLEQQHIFYISAISLLAMKVNMNLIKYTKYTYTNPTSQPPKTIKLIR